VREGQHARLVTPVTRSTGGVGNGVDGKGGKGAAHRPDHAVGMAAGAAAHHRTATVIESGQHPGIGPSGSQPFEIVGDGG
jgi:hypothetical protein